MRRRALIIISAGLILALAGISASGGRSVWRKASMVCLECVGIG